MWRNTILLFLLLVAAGVQADFDITSLHKNLGNGELGTLYDWEVYVTKKTDNPVKSDITGYVSDNQGQLVRKESLNQDKFRDFRDLPSLIHLHWCKTTLDCYKSDSDHMKCYKHGGDGTVVATCQRAQYQVNSGSTQYIRLGYCYTNPHCN